MIHRKGLSTQPSDNCATTPRQPRLGGTDRCCLFSMLRLPPILDINISRVIAPFLVCSVNASYTYRLHPHFPCMFYVHFGRCRFRKSLCIGYFVVFWTCFYSVRLDYFNNPRNYVIAVVSTWLTDALIGSDDHPSVGQLERQPDCPTRFRAKWSQPERRMTTVAWATEPNASPDKLLN